MYIKVMCEKCSALQEESSEGLHAAYTHRSSFWLGTEDKRAEL